MQNKLAFLAGLGTGYVLGARAGRGQYEQIKRQSAKAWQSAPVQHKVADAAQAVKAKTPAQAHGLVDKAVEAVSGGTATTATTTSSSTPSGSAKGTGPTGMDIVDASAT